MKSLLRLLTAVFLLFFISCGDKNQPTETHNLFKFKDYISHNTYGNRSIEDPIIIELAQQLEAFELNQEIPATYLKIRPKVEGELSIQDGRTLIFQPSEALQPDTEYAVTVLLDKLYDDIQGEFKNYTFAFKTLTPDFRLNLGNLQSYSKEWQYVSGTIESADVISLEAAKKLFNSTQNNKNLKIDWSADEGKSRYFNFTIDSIQRLTEDSNIHVIWDGKPIGAETKGKEEFLIPGKNNFVVTDLKTNLSPQSSLAINFSDPIAEGQNFNGLVTVEGAEDLRFEIDGNVLHVYPANRIVGNVRVTLFNGIKNTDNYTLKSEFSELVSFERLKPAVKLLSNGVILPNAMTTPLQFEAVNLKAIDVRVIKVFEGNMLQFLQSSNLNYGNEYDLKRVGRRIAKKTISLQENDLDNSGVWKAHAIDLSQIFRADPGSLYHVELSFKKEYNAFGCGEDSSEENTEGQYNYGRRNSNSATTLDEAEREERFWDNELYQWRYYQYNWREEDNPCHSAYYQENKFAKTNVLGSDLALIVKKGKNKTYHFATTNLLTTEPEAGTTIKLYNFQQQLIKTVTTDREGFTLYDSEESIFFAVAQKGPHYAYAKLEDGNALSLSKFDVSGKELQKGLKGFLYTERGVHRPGDSIHLTFALNDATNPLPKNHPVTLEITDARGKLSQRTVQNTGVEGFYYFPITTAQDAPTGTWNATVKVGGTSFSKSLKVATIKPNRLKLKLDFKDEVLDASKAVEGEASALWLHGAPARNLKIEMDATIRSTRTAFPKFTKYHFNDPVRSFDEIEIPILEGELSSEGVTNFSKSLNLGKNAPGMLKATFLTKVFEGGGDFSIDVFSKDVAPFSHFVGLRSPEPHRYGSYFTDENMTFDLVSVDAQGDVSPNRELEVKVFKIEWRWWWNRGRDNLSRYEDATVHRPVQEFKVTTDSKGKGNFKLKIPEKERGRYLIRVIDKESRHATGRITYFYRNWWSRPSDGDTESAKMLVFSADKDTYQVGEEAIVNFPSGSEGRALISVENGTEVLSQQWVKTVKGESQAKIKITKEMAPNVYVNISLLQPHAQTKNDLPIRLYGVVPILVEDANTILEPQLTMPEVLQPEETFSISVSEKNQKTMTYTVAMVDEGLLDLTRFATPKIHDAFYTRESLGVKTFDIFDYVIGAYSGTVNNIYAIGGGGAAAAAKNRKADRFKPVVRYLGAFTLKAGETASHRITMPNYVGSVRTMIIAGDNPKSAYGKADVTTPVRKPLMVLASLPRKLSPGEIVTLPVTVFAMEKKVKNAKIEVKTGNGLRPTNGSTKTVNFPSVGEQIVNFEFEVIPTTEIQTIEVLASGSGETSSYKVEIDVLNPNPVSQKTTQFTLSDNETETISFDTYGVAGSNEAVLEFSTLPSMDFDKRLGYLIRYPHGCIEQTTSGAFPQLYLADVVDIDFDKKKELEVNIKAAITRLGNFQTANGGLAYWPGESDVNSWGTNYAGHFMLEAKSKGFALPITFMNNWLRYQKNEARQYRNNNTRYNSSLIQARLYTLALAGQPELAAMNRLRESKQLSNDAKWRLAASYALAGNKKVAEQISKTANITFKPQRYDYYTYGSPFRNKSMALETMVLLEDPRQRDMAISVAKELSSQSWYSTQETSYALLAMAKLVQKNGGKDVEVSFAQNGNSTTVKTDRVIAQRTLSVTTGTNSVSVKNNKNNVLYVTLSQKGKYPLGQEKSDQRNFSIRTQFLNGQGNVLNVSELRQGSEITAKVVVTNNSNDYVDNVALSQIFPSGWEVVNTSFTELGGGAEGKARYTDIKDDRVNFYFDIRARKSRTFEVKLNASYLGKYYLPGSHVEAMYDNNYYARNKGQWIEVKQ